MKLFGRRIVVSDLTPPIFYRLIRFFKKKIYQWSNKAIVSHPFDSIPDSIHVKWILDIGANRGDVSVAALQTYPTARVVCFEPVKSTYEQLVTNLHNYSQRVTLFNLALSNESGEVDINITTAHGANSIEPQTLFHKECNPHVREIGKEKIQTVRLDDFVKTLPNQKFEIVKIDVEGHELSVLKGGEKFFSTNVDVIIIELSLMRDTSFEEQALFEIFSFLKQLGFRLINIIDLYHAEGMPMQLTQMDCVFRHKRNLDLSNHEF